MAERALIDRLLRPLASTPPARGLRDDAAVWAPPLGRDLVFTHDSMAAGVHYLPSDPPGDVAWKLLAVNLSDLAAMGARPSGCLLSLALSAAEDAAWQEAFVAGLGRALAHFGCALWGGDTIGGTERTVLGLTAIGQVSAGAALARSGARPGDALWVSGTIGDAGRGLAIAQGTMSADAATARRLLKRYRLPMPRLALGERLVGTATAAMDVSDGLLIDAERLAVASGVGLAIDLMAVPVSDEGHGSAGTAESLRLAAATAGDDYELLFTAPAAADVPAIAAAAKTPVTRIGTVVAGAGLSLTGSAGPLPLPHRLGWEHLDQSSTPIASMAVK